MILDEKIKVKVHNNTLKYYNDKNYKCIPKEIIEILTTDLPPQSTQIINVKCDICGKEKTMQYRKYVNNTNNKGFYTCSLSCSQAKIKLTKIENHGDPNYCNIEKRNQTCKDKYNDENYKNVEKQKETNLKKYGCEHVMMNNDIKEKRKNLWLDKYDEIHPMKNADVKSKKRKTSFNRHGKENYNNIEKTLNTIKEDNIKKLSEKFSLNVIDYQDKLFTIICDKGHEYKSNYDLIFKRYKYNIPICTVCNPVGNQYSAAEKSILNFIKENYNDEIIENSRNIINPYEIDIFLPKLNLAIEFNGLYWHSEIYHDKSYHKMKYDMCKNNNIQLIQIFEDDWSFKQDIVKSMILNKIHITPNKIFARKCQIKELSDVDIKEFLQKNHIQGYTKSSIKLGLFYQDNIVSVMTFMKNDKNYELNRFCNKINYNIVGGASKLFNHFIKNYNFENIISFSNNLYSNGNLYYKLNFKKLSELNADYSYIVENKRYHKFNFRKKNELTEREYNLSKNYLRIYDAGKIKFIYS